MLLGCCRSENSHTMLSLSFRFSDKSKTPEMPYIDAFDCGYSHCLRKLSLKQSLKQSLRWMDDYRHRCFATPMGSGLSVGECPFRGRKCTLGIGFHQQTQTTTEPTANDIGIPLKSGNPPPELKIKLDSWKSPFQNVYPTTDGKCKSSKQTYTQPNEIALTTCISPFNTALANETFVSILECVEVHHHTKYTNV